MAEKILFIDSTCVLCDGFAKWLLGRVRPESNLYISSLSSDMLGQISHDQAVGARDAVLLLTEGRLESGAAAVLGLGPELERPWPLVLKVLDFLPAWLKEAAYDWLAARRKFFFGSQDSCSLEVSRNSRFIF